MNNLKFTGTLILFLLVLSGCNGKLPGADARKFPADPKKRVEKNMQEGKAFRLSEITTGGKGGTFEFASSNELWRASLDVLDFMPLASVNYSGGIIITDWYSNNQTPSESIKISVRFLTNEIRSDAIDIKIFGDITLPFSSTNPASEIAGLFVAHPTNPRVNTSKLRLANLINIARRLFLFVVLARH